MDMPLTAPRVPMAQAVDDVTVRDRVLRSFPEVEQAVGKIGRAETATDPSPVDMVETIVSMRPHDLWPKRKISFDDAMAHARIVAVEMEKRGWLKNIHSPEFDPILNTATQIAVDRFDRSMRDLARRRQLEYEPQLAWLLFDFVANDVVQHARTLPPRDGHPAVLRDLSSHDSNAAFESLRDQAALIAELPRQEQLDSLLVALRIRFVKQGILADRDDLFIDYPNPATRALRFVGQAIGRKTPSYSERLLDKVQANRDALWSARIKTLNWELFDYGKLALTDILLESLEASAKGTPIAASLRIARPPDDLRSSLTRNLEKRLFLWTKTKDDLVHEMDSELQMPGWGNVWTQPIINRVNMLATGVRTQIGVKIFGPTGKSLPDAIKDIQHVSEDLAARLKQLPGAVDVVADQATGKRYVEIEINRDAAARYGINAADISEAVQTAIGGSTATTTVEGRQRFPVQLRYTPQSWQTLESLKNTLIPINTTAPRLSQDSGLSTQDSLTLIPLHTVADLRITDGPSMIKSENGRLRNYVTLNVRGRDIVGFVAEAQQAIKPIESKLAGTGMTIEWSGEFENQLRARQTLSVIFPMVVVLILLLLYITFKDFTDTLLVSLAVLGALAGAVMFQALFGFNFSVIVSIGYIAAFGMATQTGVIMLVYLREALEKRGGLEKISSLAELRQAVIEGAVHRLRPKLLTEGVAIVGLVPMLWATGTGAEIMRPMAAPVLGGLLISDDVIDIMIPVLFYWIRRRRWLRLHEDSDRPRSTTARIAQVPAMQL